MGLPAVGGAILWLPSRRQRMDEVGLLGFWRSPSLHNLRIRLLADAPSPLAAREAGRPINALSRSWRMQSLIQWPTYLFLAARMKEHERSGAPSATLA